MTIAKPHDELYRFWRNLENLPGFMPHLVSVKDLGDNARIGVAKAPGGRTVEWDADTINDEVNESLGWRTLEGSDVVSAGLAPF